MVAPTQFAHIVFRTNDLQRMIDWYCTVLDAKVVFGNDKVAFLSFDDEHHRIALTAREPYEPKPAGLTVGFVHAAYTLANLTQLLDTYDRLKACGIVPTRTINHGQTISFYYRDPDGNDIELQIDCFPNGAQAKQWMQSAPFARNPVGILVEPAALRAQLEAGVVFEEIARRADALE
jgi:catechol-2,3-dioxygenase